VKLRASRQTFQPVLVDLGKVKPPGMASGTCPSFEHTLGLWQPLTPRFAYDHLALSAVLAPFVTGHASLAGIYLLTVADCHSPSRVYVTAEEPTRSCVKATANCRPMPQNEIRRFVDQLPGSCRPRIHQKLRFIEFPVFPSAAREKRGASVGGGTLLSDLKSPRAKLARSCENWTIWLTITLAGLGDRWRRFRDPGWR
jgi:hypothetical protein